MDAQAFSQYHVSTIPITSSREFFCRLPGIAKCITQLKTNGDNFSVWERQLKVMIHNLTGSTTYLSHEFKTHHPKSDQVVFNLIFWSIDDELQLDLNIDGSAKDAFRVLAGRFGIMMSLDDLPVEVLERIIDIVYDQSLSEHYSTKEEKLERIVHPPPGGPAYIVYPHCHGPPILNTFQNLAAVNQKLYRLCRPKLWQKLRFPTALPGALSIWTEQILWKHGDLVKLLELEFREDFLTDPDGFSLSETPRCFYDNTGMADRSGSQSWGKNRSYGIGLVNIEKIFKSCIYLESLSIKRIVTVVRDDQERFWVFLDGLFKRIDADRLKNLRHLDLQHLVLVGIRYGRVKDKFLISLLRKLTSLRSLKLTGFVLRQKAAIEESLGWNMAQLKDLCKLRLQNVTCDDETWTLNSWPQRLKTLELDSCTGLSPRVLHGLISGSAPCLTRLQLKFKNFPDESDDIHQFALPALRRLILDSENNFDLLLSFQDCKDIESLTYCSVMDNDQWDLLKKLLSISTWPKLSVLNFRQPEWRGDEDWIERVEQCEVEFWNSFKVKLKVELSIY